MTASDWFYIRSISTGCVVSCSTSSSEEALRSQVMVTPPALTDMELWRWNGQFLCNKATGLVLDIRKGRLRVIEDTEICMYIEKPLEQAHNQLWGIKGNIVDDFGRSLPGSYIFSQSNNEWVLDMQSHSDGKYKLVLFPIQPIENENQRWSFVPEGELDTSVPMIQTSSMNTYSANDYLSPPSSASYFDTEFPKYPQGLSPAKRGSHPSIYSIEAFRDYHSRIYSAAETSVSDKAIAMASAYEIFQKWKLQNENENTMHYSSPTEFRFLLQSMAQSEVNKLLSGNSCYSDSHVDSISTLSGKLVIHLHDQTPLSP